MDSGIQMISCRMARSDGRRLSRAIPAKRKPGTSREQQPPRRPLCRRRSRARAARRERQRGGCPRESRGRRRDRPARRPARARDRGRAPRRARPGKPCRCDIGRVGHDEIERCRAAPSVHSPRTISARSATPVPRAILARRTCKRRGQVDADARRLADSRRSRAQSSAPDPSRDRAIRRALRSGRRGPARAAPRVSVSSRGSSTPGRTCNRRGRRIRELPENARKRLAAQAASGQIREPAAACRAAAVGHRVAQQCRMIEDRSRPRAAAARRSRPARGRPARDSARGMRRACAERQADEGSGRSFAESRARVDWPSAAASGLQARWCRLR